MPGTTIEQEIEIIVEDTGGGGGKPPARDGGGDDGGGKRRRPWNPSPRRYYTGVTLGILSILMFFMALASAFIVRRGSSSNDWMPVHIPAILWLNTAVLLFSSLTLELARKRLASADLSGFRRLWTVTTFLGLLFLTGQILAWRQLIGQGIFVATNPGSSFFYVFTGLHGLHLLGGVGALMYVALRNFERAKLTRQVAAEIVGHYWHFMDALWVFLLALLYLGK